MPLNRAFEGREYPLAGPFEVTTESIREFAEAIGDANPMCRDAAIAKAAGHPDVVAPPTYLTKLSFVYSPQIVLDPELGLDYSLVVHGEQEFVHVRPLCAGDTIVARPRIGSITARGRNEYMITEATIETITGEKIAEVRSTIVSRGTAPQE